VGDLARDRPRDRQALRPAVIAAVVLAAGTGSRFGGTKQLATVGGKPLVRHAVDTARQAGIDEVVVVVGHEAGMVREAVGTIARVVHNRRFSEGQATSLAAGLDALGEDVDAAVVLLADQPGVTGEHVEALVQAAAHRVEPIVRLRFEDGPGPALLRRSIWDEARALTGDAGARALIERRPDLVFEAVVEGAAPSDVDTAADLERLDGTGDAGTGYEKPPSF
jgi:CTP:molybdopterin cytidylyltransferase MocA